MMKTPMIDRQSRLRFLNPFAVAGQALDSLTPYPQTEGERRFESQRVAAEVQRRLTPLSAPLQALVRDVRSLGVSDVDLFHGSHVVLRDGGERYRSWRGMGTQRISSHYREVSSKQYEVDLGKLGALLFGVDPNGDTWFQLEASALGKSLLQKARHGADFLLHVASGKLNVGPLGLSPYTEKRGAPLIVS